MPYSDPQLAQLSAMGLVAWVERPGRAGAEGPAAGDPASGEPGAPAPSSSATGVVLASPALGPSGAVPSAPGSTTPVPAAEPGPAPESATVPRPPSGRGHPEESGERLSAVSLASESLRAGRQDVSDPLVPAPSAPPALPMPMPREPAVLATWLPAQPLAPFVYREQTLTRVGSEAAPLLIVVERGAPSEGLPLIGEAAELFERMLRSIGLTRRDTRQCVLSSEPASGEADTVGAFAAAPYRAVLVLMQELDGGLGAPACRFLLDGTGAGSPGWCLPHPERLLREPLRKAQAWEVFKALRRHLGAGA